MTLSVSFPKENISVFPSQYFLKRWSKEAKPKSVIDKVGNTVQAVTNILLVERHSELSSIAQMVVAKGSMSGERFELAKTRMHSLILELNDLPEIIQDGTTLDDSGNTYTNVLFEATTANQCNESITTGAPSHKRPKGASTGRQKGFYDSMKKRKAKNSNTKISRNLLNDNITEDDNIEEPLNNEQVSSIPTAVPSIHDGVVNGGQNLKYPLATNNASLFENSKVQPSDRFIYSQIFDPRMQLENVETTGFPSFQALLQSQVGFTTNSPLQLNLTVSASSICCALKGIESATATKCSFFTT